MTDAIEDWAKIAAYREALPHGRASDADILKIWNIYNAHHLSEYARGIRDALLELGLIKPEPTREERFWAETGADKSAFTPVVLDLLNKALEF